MASSKNILKRRRRKLAQQVSARGKNRRAALSDSFERIETLEPRVLLSATFTVDDSGGADFLEIQDAVDAASDGDTINVLAGSYGGVVIDSKNLLIDGIVSNPADVTINGASPALHLVGTAQVFLRDVSLTTTTASHTVQVSNTASLNLRRSIVTESNTDSQHAFQVSDTASLDLGTAGDMGLNVIDVNGPLNLIRNDSPNDIPALGNTFTNGGSVLDNFEIEGRVRHGMDVPGTGLVTWNAGNVYVTTSTLGVEDAVRLLGNATAAAGPTPGATVNVSAGQHDIAGMIVTTDTNIVGAGKGTTTLNAIANTGTVGSARGFWQVEPGIEFNVSDLTFDGRESGGTQHDIYHLIRTEGFGTIERVGFTHILHPLDHAGFGVIAFGGAGSGGSVDVLDSMFGNIGTAGVLYFGTGTSGEFSRNMYTGKGAGDQLDIAVEVGGGAEAVISQNTITGNTGILTSDGSTSSGVLVTSVEPLVVGVAPISKATITNNFINGNAVGILIGIDADDVSDVTATENNLSGNVLSGLDTIGASNIVDASANWWGTRTEEGVFLEIAGADNVDRTPWLEVGDDTSGDAGFQGDFSTLNATILGAQVGDVGRVQEAINLVTDQEVILHDGFYEEDILFNKDVKLTSENGFAVTTLMGIANDDPNIDVTANGARIIDMTIAMNPGDVGINVNGFLFRLLNSLVETVAGTTTAGAAGATIGLLTGDADINPLRIEGNTFRGIDGDGPAISLSGTGDPETLITKNRFEGGYSAALEVLGGTGAVVFTNNAVVTTGALAINNETAMTLDASANYWDSADPVAINDRMGGPVDFTPFLMADVTNGLGFCGDFSLLGVTILGEQIQPDGRIQEGIDRVDDPGTVRVFAGTYNEQFIVPRNKDRTLDLIGDPGPDDDLGAGPDAPIVDGTGIAGFGGTTEENVDLLISGFRFQNWTSSGGGGAGAIDVGDSDGDVDVEDTDIDNVDVGVLVERSDVRLLRSTITNAGVFGLEVSNNANVFVDNSRIEGAGTAGIVVDDNGDLDVEESIITGNATGILVTSIGDRVRVFNSNLAGNTGQAISSTDSQIVEASGNWWGTTDEAAVDAAVTGPIDFTPFLNTGDDADAGKAVFQGDFSFLNVTTLGEQEGGGDRIQEGIDLVEDTLVLSGSGDLVVNVLAGTYPEDFDVNVAGVEVRGAGAGSAIVNGQSADPNVAVTADGVEVHGFTFNGTGATGMGLTGGGANIHDNTLTGSATGIENANGDGNAITNNDITATTGVLVSGGSATLTDNSYTGTTGVSVTGGTATINEAATLDGLTTGVDVSGGTALIDGSTITNNTTGVLVTGGEAKVSNSTVTGNSTGVDVNGGFAIVETSDLNGNTIGVLIRGGSQADLGQINGLDISPSGTLGRSVGGNNFESYTVAATAASGAIVDINDDGGIEGQQGRTSDIPAQANFFAAGIAGASTADIETVIWHDPDDVVDPSFQPDFVDFEVTLGDLAFDFDVDLDSINETESVILSNGSFTNSEAGKNHTVLIEWGDGLTDMLGLLGVDVYTFAATHTFADDGLTPGGSPSHVYDITVTVRDISFDAVVGIEPLTVNNIDPSALTVGIAATTGDDITVKVDEGDSVTVDGSFADPGTLDEHTVTINWGDETTSTVLDVGDREFSIDHIYADNGDFDITVTVTDDDTGSVSDSSLSATVNNAVPTVTLTADPTAVLEGETDTSKVTIEGSFADAGVNDTHTLSVDWGDDTPSETLTHTDGEFMAMHIYKDDNPTGDPVNTNDIVVTVTDNDGGAGTGTAPVEVTNVDPVFVDGSLAVTSTSGTASVSGADLAIDEGDVVELVGAFTDLGVQDTHIVTVDWGDSTSQSFNSGAGILFQIVHEYQQDSGAGDFTITVTVTDDDTGTATDDSLTVNVSNVAPSNVVLEMPASIDENGVATLTGTFEDPSALDVHVATIDWGDGTTEPMTFDPVGSRSDSATHQYLDDGLTPGGSPSFTYTISVVVNDGTEDSAPGTTTVVVNNVDPADVAIIGQDPVTSGPTPPPEIPASVPEGTNVNMTADFTDVGTLDTHTFAWSATKNGDPFATGTAQDFTLTPDDEGEYVVTLTVTDDDTGSSSDSVTINATNVPVSIENLTVSEMVDENSSVTITGDINDPGGADAFTLVAFDWGDGETDTFNYAPGTTSFSETHQYIDDNPTGTPEDTYTIDVSLSDGTDTVSASVDTIVKNVDPVIAGLAVALTAGDLTIDENDNVTLTGTITDVGTEDTFDLTVDWGDGSAAETLSFGTGDQPFSLTHTYLDDDPTDTATDDYTITVTATDDDTGADVETLNVTVDNVTPTLADLTVGAAVLGPAPAPPEFGEGTLVEVSGNIVDPGSLDTFEVLVEWGDGATETISVASLTDGDPDFTATHAYADDGDQTIMVTVTDDDTGTSTEELDVSIVNVDPTAVIDVSDNPQEGSKVEFTGSADDPGSDDTHTFSWEAIFALPSLTFSVSLDTNQEVPAPTINGTTPSGSATVNVDTITGLVDISGSYTGMTSNVVASHLHGLAGPGTATGVLFGLSNTGGTAGTIDGSGTLTPAELFGLLNGETYINVHMLNNGPGEIRGQVGGPGTVITGTGETLSVTPDDDGVLVVSLTATDDDGGVGTTTQIVEIANVAPTVELDGVPQPVNEGSTFTLSGMNLFDPGDDTVTQMVVEWGDGTSEDVTGVNTGDHVYANDGTYNARVLLTDEDGTHVGATFDVEVLNVNASGLQLDAVGDINEGDTIKLTGGFDDPGTLDEHTLDINWGDGTSDTVVLPVGDRDFSVSHQYVDDDPSGTASDTYTISVTVADDSAGGGAASLGNGPTDTTTVVVSNVDPDPLIQVPAGDLFQLVPLTLTADPNDPGDDEHTFSWDIQFGGSTVASGTDRSITFTPNQAGTYTVNVDVGDDDLGSGTGTTTVAILPVPTFQVLVGTGNASGYDATFNETPDFGPLNLYDGLVDPPDVTLVGRTVGNVNGSLILDGLTMSFVATGGVLVPDVYDVRIRSGSDALQNESGEALDGDRNGTPGDDFTDTFTVTNGTRVLTIPDFARGGGQSGNIPLTVAGTSTDIVSVDVTVWFDPTLLDVTGATAGLPGWVVGPVNLTTPGRAIISAFGPAASGDDLVALTIQASVPDDAPYGGSQVIRLTGGKVDEVDATGDRAVHKAVFFGDTDRSRGLGGNDALQSARKTVELTDGFDAYPLIDPLIIGDITGDGTISGFDSSLIAQAAAGGPVPQIPGIPAGVPPLSVGGPDPLLTIPSNIAAKAGTSVAVPVLIDDATGVAFASIDVHYDPNVLSITEGDVSDGGLWPQLDNWLLTPNVVTPGHLRVIVFNASGHSDAEGSGEIVNLEFSVIANAPGGLTPLDVGSVDPNEGDLTWTNADGSILVISGVNGDVNNDGVVNNLDITPFVVALSVDDEAAFLDQVDGGNYAAADTDASGAVNNLDITPFMEALAGRTSAASSQGGLSSWFSKKSAKISGSANELLGLDDASTNDIISQWLNG